MALSEVKVIDKVEVVENGSLQVREATKIMKDGEEIAKTYHRWSFAPGSDVSEMPANVQAIAAAAWTPEVISAYEEQLAQQIAARAEQGA
jgi:hypothetical protein